MQNHAARWLGIMLNTPRPPPPPPPPLPPSASPATKTTHTAHSLLAARYYLLRRKTNFQKSISCIDITHETKELNVYFSLTMKVVNEGSRRKTNFPKSISCIDITHETNELNVYFSLTMKLVNEGSTCVS